MRVRFFMSAEISVCSPSAELGRTLHPGRLHYLEPYCETPVVYALAAAKSCLTGKPCMLGLDRRWKVSNLIGTQLLSKRVKKEHQLDLPANAILPSRICDASNNPFTIRTDKIEQVRPAVVHLAIHQKLEGSPHHRQIVIDPH